MMALLLMVLTILSIGIGVLLIWINLLDRKIAKLEISISSMQYQIDDVLCDINKLANKLYLEDLWHDTSEKPNKYEFILFEYVSNRNELKYFANYVTKGTYGMLQEFEKFGKCRWAYIKDLLPKTK